MAGKRIPKTPDAAVAVGSLVRLVGQLEENLARAVEVYENQSAEVGRVLTIQVLNTYLLLLGIDVRLRQPLISLHGILVDADRAGAEMPLSKMADMVRAAVTLDILVGCRVKVADAANRVSRVVGGDFSAKQVIEYRKNVRGGQARAEAVAMFWEMVKEAKTVWGDLPLAMRAEEALGALRQSVVRPAKE